MHHLIVIRNFLIYLFIGLFFLFPRLQPLSFSIAFFLTLFTGEFNGKFKEILTNKYFILFTLFFATHFYSISYSSDDFMTWSRLELKLSFFVFPLFLPTILNSGKIKTNYLLEFTYLSAILSFFILFFRGVYRYFQIQDLEVFFSSEFSFIVHPSYLAIMLNILLSIALYRLIKSNSASKKIWVSILILTTYIILAAAKIGLILLFINAFGALIVFTIKNNKKIQAIGFSILIILMAFLIVRYVPKINSKFNQAYQETFNKDYSIPTNNLSSTGQRIVAWKTTSKIIKQNVFWGVGIGDLKNDLAKQYQEDGFDSMVKKRLDSHQQFMQSWATVGLFGLVLLSLIFILLFYDSLKNKSYTFFMFVLCFFLFGLTESMFETQAGVLSFLFFFYILSNKHIIRVLKSSL